MVAPILALLLAAAPFPLPSVDGKPLAAAEGQKTFRLPTRFEKVRAFYAERFGDNREQGVTMTLSGTSGARVISLASKRIGDTWKRATIREGDGETVIEVTPVLRMAADSVEGNGKPLVEFVIGRNPDAAKAAEKIDHTESIHAR